MFNFCPSCASKNISFSKGKLFRCPDCGFSYYQNIAAATGCLITVPHPDGERFLFTVRAKNPAKGLLDLPGGFVDIGEGVFNGLCRELQEEIGWVPPVPEGVNPASVFTLFASFPNIYEYKGIKYNTCDMYFHVSAPGLTPADLHLEQAEISGVHFLRHQEIDFDRLAFKSTKQAIKAWLDKAHMARCIID